MLKMGCELILLYPYYIQSKSLQTITYYYFFTNTIHVVGVDIKMYMISKTKRDILVLNIIYQL